MDSDKSGCEAFNAYVNMQNVKVLDIRKLEVIPPGDREKVHFELHALKNLLPRIVVKVRFLDFF